MKVVGVALGEKVGLAVGIIVVGIADGRKVGG